jgi:hypothetical protein
MIILETERADRRTNEYTIKDVIKHSGMQIQGVHFFDNHFLYVLYHSGQYGQITDQSNGFGILDLDILNTDPRKKPLLLPVCDTVGGINHEFVFCKQDKRLVFLQDYDKLLSVPLLHTSSIVF